MINAIIIDEEVKSMVNLETMLKIHCPEVYIVAKKHNVFAGFEAIRTLSPQLVFLDVDISPYTAFDLLRMFDHINFSVVFLAEFDHFALEAIKFSALYYILKPIKSEELIEAVNRAKLKKNFNDKLNVNYSNEKDKREITSIIIQTHRGSIIINIFDIIYIKAQNNYSTFILKTGERIMASRSLKNYEKILSFSGFFRCHKAFLINLHNLPNSIQIKAEYLIMSNGDLVALSVRRKEDFFKKIKTIR
jgi:two-component system LytT family response regulator